MLTVGRHMLVVFHNFVRVEFNSHMQRQGKRFVVHGIEKPFFLVGNHRLVKMECCKSGKMSLMSESRESFEKNLPRTAGPCNLLRSLTSSKQLTSMSLCLLLTLSRLNCNVVSPSHNVCSKSANISISSIVQFIPLKLIKIKFFFLKTQTVCLNDHNNIIWQPRSRSRNSLFSAKWMRLISV